MRDMSPLDSWLKVGTWHTFHPLDEERFYKAVRQLMVINKPHPEPQHVKEYILSKMKGKFNEEYLELTATQYVDKYDAIFSFIYENKISI